MSLRLMFLTNDPNVAEIAQNAGVDRILVDLEKLGKAERQGHIDSVKSNHSLNDIKTLRSHIQKAELLVRINPINPASTTEINTAIEYGADSLMLPMFRTTEEVKEFLQIVSGRTKTTLLLETAEAEARIENILKIPGINEIHIGLNDLHLAHKLSFMFELLSNGTVEMLCRKIKAYGIPFGFGGISALGSGMLSAERIIAEHYRLGSSMVILSRSFCNTAEIRDLIAVENIFNQEITKIRQFESFLSEQREVYFSENQAEIKAIVSNIVSRNKRLS